MILSQIDNLKQNNTLILDYKTSLDKILYLESLGFKIIRTIKEKKLYNAIDGHPDIQMLKLGDTLFLHKNISVKFLNNLEKQNIKYEITQSELMLPYPKNIPFNCVISNDLFIHKIDSTDPLILNKIKTTKLKLIDIKQGYTRCSLSYIGKDSYITEDKTIAKKLMSLNKNVFFREHSNVYLEGFDYGFIGGSISLVKFNNENVLLIDGNIDQYRYGKELKSFLNNINISYISIGKGKLKDNGSIIQI